MQQQPLPYIIRSVVERVSTVMTPLLQAVEPAIEHVRFEFGHPLEIIDTLQLATVTQATARKKYPVVCLFEDIPVERGISGYYGEARVQMIVAHHTVADLRSAQRTERTFIPILTPIYERLILELINAGLLIHEDRAQHTMIERKYWGKQGLYGNEGNIFNDHLDAIEIRDLRLRVPHTSCDIGGRIV